MDYAKPNLSQKYLLLTIGPWYRDNLISCLGEEQDTLSLDYELPTKKPKMDIPEPKPEQAALTPTYTRLLWAILDN